MRHALRFGSATLLVTLALAGCAAQPPARSVGSTPIGTSAASATPTISARGVGNTGIDAPYYTGADPDFPRGSHHGRS